MAQTGRAWDGPLRALPFSHICFILCAQKRVLGKYFLGYLEHRSEENWKGTPEHQIHRCVFGGRGKDRGWLYDSDQAMALSASVSPSGVIRAAFISSQEKSVGGLDPACPHVYRCLSVCPYSQAGLAGCAQVFGTRWAKAGRKRWPRPELQSQRCTRLVSKGPC